MTAAVLRGVLRTTLLLLLLCTGAAVAAAPASASPVTALTTATTGALLAPPAAQTLPAPPVLPVPTVGGDPSTAPATDSDGGITVDLDGGVGKPSQTVSIILLLTVLSIAPAVLILTTSFTRIVIVLSLTRNALGVQAIPPNQVIIGLSLFLSLFIMQPTLSQVNDDGLQPYLKGEKSFQQAYDDGVGPVRDFMVKETGDKELAMFIEARGDERPAEPTDVSMAALVPAFVLSEIKTAFLIGFIVFIPFLVIDIVISSSLMSMGMMMLPPVLISLPFKLLLFVMVDGWSLVVRSLLTSYG